MAAAQGAAWLAVSVESSHPLDADAARRLEKNLTLARELGAEIVVTHDDDIASALLRVARSRAAPGSSGVAGSRRISVISGPRSNGSRSANLCSASSASSSAPERSPERSRASARRWYARPPPYPASRSRTRP